MANEETKVEAPTAEEVAADTEAQKVAKEEEVRAELVTELGLDEVEDEEKITKLVAREMKNREKLSKAIGQKVHYRTLASGKVVAEKEPEVKTTPAADVEKTATGAVTKALAERDLEEMDLPEDITKEIRRIAEIQGVTVKKAAKDPYIVSRIEAAKSAAETEEASISRKNKTGGKKSWSIDSPPDVDMSTPEGRKEWADYKAEMAKQGN